MSERGHHVTSSNQQFANFLYENELITDTSHLTTTDVARALGMMARNVSVNTSNPADGGANEETWNVGVFVSTLMDIVRPSFISLSSCPLTSDEIATGFELVSGHGASRLP